MPLRSGRRCCVIISVPLCVTVKISTSSCEVFLRIDQLTPWHSKEIKVPALTTLLVKQVNWIEGVGIIWISKIVSTFQKWRKIIHLLLSLRVFISWENGLFMLQVLYFFFWYLFLWMLLYYYSRWLPCYWGMWPWR